jgi:hypothetical protein
MHTNQTGSFQQIDRVQDDPADILEKKDRIYWFRFDPTDKPTPPHLEADLGWVIPAVSISLFLLWKALQRLQDRGQPSV